MRDAALPGLMILVSIPICICDLRAFRIPNLLVAVAALVIAPAAVALRGPFGAAAGAVYVGGVLALARGVTRGGLGGGDVKYGVVVGLATGPVLAPAALLGAAGTAAVVLRRGGRRRLPFAPALAAAAVVVLAVEPALESAAQGGGFR
jgi:leader peptidase (prepilin peptidase)/N-methyltransferase